MEFSSLLIECVFAFACATVAQLLGTALTLLPLRRIPPETHWSERARRCWSARQLIGLAPAVLLGINLAATADEMHGVREVLRAVFVPLSALFGAMCGGIPAARRVFRRRMRLRDQLRDYAVSFLVISPGITVFLLMLLLLLSRGLDATSIGIMAVATALAFALSFGLALPVVRGMGLLSPAPERLERIVRDAAAKAGVETPPVFVLQWNYANALAFPFARLLAFTPPILKALTDEELFAITAHEIAHLNEPSRAKLTRLMGLLVWLPMFTIPVWGNTFGVLGFVIPLLIMAVGGRLMQKFTQQMERRADHAAHAHGADPRAAAFAQALEKIYEFNLIPAVMRGRRQSHPHLYDRLIAAGVQPSYSRPKAPSVALLFVALIFVVTASQAPLFVAELFVAKFSLRDSAESPLSADQLDREHER